MIAGVENGFGGLGRRKTETENANEFWNDFKCVFFFKGIRFEKRHRKIHTKHRHSLFRRKDTVNG